MELKELTKRAIEIRKMYADFEKIKYGREWSNSEIMQGFMVDTGELMEAVMAKSKIREMKNIDEKISHELSDCLWSILVLANKFGIDLEKEFIINMDKLENKIKNL